MPDIKLFIPIVFKRALHSLSADLIEKANKIKLKINDKPKRSVAKSRRDTTAI